MTNREREEIEAEALRIVANWKEIEDPVAELDALDDRAGPTMAAFFMMVGSDLARAMSEGDD